MPAQRSDQFAVSVTVNGHSHGIWDTFSGGETDSDDTKHRPGAMGPEEAIGGPPSVGNVTVGRAFRRARDIPLVANLRPEVGRGRAVVKVQPLDTDGNVFGDPEVYRGILKRVTPPEHDSDSSDVANVELEVVCDETVG